MKLPEDKNKRTKVVALIAAGALGVLYGLFAGVLQPMARAKAGYVERIAQLQEDVSKAKKQVSRMTQDRDDSIEALRTILAESEKTVLTPRLGNFLLGATDIIDAAAQRADVILDNTREIGVAQLPAISGSKEPHSFRSYAVALSATLDTPALIRLLGQLEAQNPYLCISEIRITARDGAPGEHNMSVRVQWPAWNDPDLPDVLRAELHEFAPEESSAESSPEA